MGFVSSKSNSVADKALVEAVFTFGVVFAIAGIAVSTFKCNKEAKKDLENVLSIDTNVKSFDLKYVECISEDDDYFLNFSGSVIKTTGQPINFATAKYQISEENYYELESQLDKKGINEVNNYNSSSFFKDLLDIVYESELVSVTNNDELSLSLKDEERGEVLALKSVKKPVIYKDNGVAAYEVEVIKYNENEINNPKIEILTKQVVVKLTEDIEKQPLLAYKADKSNCKVRTIIKETMTLNDNEVVPLSCKR